MKLTALLACVLSCGFAFELCNNDTASLQPPTSRRKRSLTFPKGSAVVLTVAMLKAVQLLEPANWNLDLEFDVIWPLPAGLDALTRKPTTTTTTRRPPPPLEQTWPAAAPFDVYYEPYDYWEPHRRHRRELYANFELALDSQGLPGKHCILHTICEAKLVLNPPGLSLVEDLLRVVFSYPSSFDGSDRYDEAYKRQPHNCDTIYPCPFSLLHLLLNYRDDVTKLFD